MTLYEELVLIHYRHLIKHQSPGRAMQMACKEAYRAMQNHVSFNSMSDGYFDKPLSERMEDWSLANVPEFRNRTMAKKAVDAYFRAFEE